MSNSNLYRNLSQEEMRNINGGIPWGAIGGGLITKNSIITALGEGVSAAIDWLRKRL